jgi:hypothetical protein
VTAAEETYRELREALGDLVLGFVALEEDLHDAIFVLAEKECPRDRRTVSVLTAGLGFRTLVGKFGALCNELRPVEVSQADVVEFCNHLNRLNDRRNQMVHSAWVWAERGPAGVHRRKRTADPKKGFSHPLGRATVEEVRDLAQDFVNAGNKVWEIIPWVSNGEQHG